MNGSVNGKACIESRNTSSNAHRRAAAGAARRPHAVAAILPRPASIATWLDWRLSALQARA
eukprot:3410238-Prymnesium_polylepis.1